MSSYLILALTFLSFLSPFFPSFLPSFFLSLLPSFRSNNSWYCFVFHPMSKFGARKWTPDHTEKWVPTDKKTKEENVILCEWEKKTAHLAVRDTVILSLCLSLGRDGPAHGLRVLVHHREAQGRAQLPDAGRSEDLLVGPSDSTLAREKEMNVSHNIRDLGKCFIWHF